MKPRYPNKMLPKGRTARLGLEITKRCNGSCIHCFAGAGREQDLEIPFEKISRIICEGARSGYRHLHITGGEPLMHGAIADTLDLAVAAGYETILLNTNGTLLDKGTCRRLANYPQLTITISLEQNEALHNRLRGKETYRKARRGLECGLEAELAIIVFTLASKSGLADLPQFADGLFRCFPDIQFLTLIRLIAPPGVSRAVHHEVLDPEDFLGLARMLSLLNAMGRPVELLNDPLLNVISHYYDLPALPLSRPLGVMGDVMVLADLSMVPYHASRSVCGGYATGAIERLESNDRYRDAIAPDARICPACRYHDVCQTNGLERPLEKIARGRRHTYFCHAVLDLKNRE